MDPFIEEAVDLLHKLIAEDPIIPTTMEFVQSAFSEDFLEKEGYYERAVALGMSTDHNKYVTFFHKYFKEKYSKTYAQWMQEAYKIKRKAALASIPQEEKHIWKYVGDMMTIELVPEHVSTSMQYYISGQRVVVQDSNFEVVIGKKSFEYLEITKDEFVAWCERNGMRKIKRPRRSRNFGPMFYD